MGDFVTANRPLPARKVDARPPIIPEQEIDAADVNDLWDAAKDLRDAIQALPLAISVKAAPYGAKGDGVTDDGTAINAAIAASPVGSVIFFPPGTYRTSVRILLKGGRTYVGSGWDSSAGAIVKLVDGVTVSAVLLAESVESNFTTAGGAVTVRDIAIDGNVAGGAAGHGLWLCNFPTTVESVQIRNTSGDAFHIEGGAAFQAAASSCVEPYFRHIRAFGVRGSGFRVVEPNANKITDGFVIDSIFGGATGNQIDGDGINIQSAAGWRVSGNHIYQIGGTAISVGGPNHCDVSGNYIESYGRNANGDGTTYYGISAQGLLSSSGSTPCIVRANRVFNSIGHTGNVFYGIYVRASSGQTGTFALVANNHVRGNGSQNGIALTNAAGGIIKGVVGGNSVDTAGANLFAVFGDGSQARVDGNTFNYATAAPPTGFWPVGTRIYHSAPAVGSPQGWVCTISGSPSTFVALANL